MNPIVLLRPAVLVEMSSFQMTKNRKGLLANDFLPVASMTQSRSVVLDYAFAFLSWGILQKLNGYKLSSEHGRMPSPQHSGEGGAVWSTLPTVYNKNKQPYLLTLTDILS